jgi:hypothetical protein
MIAVLLITSGSEAKMDWKSRIKKRPFEATFRSKDDMAARQSMERYPAEVRRRRASPPFPDLSHPHHLLP